jgi:hypothetical protein
VQLEHHGIFYYYTQAASSLRRTNLFSEHRKLDAEGAARPHFADDADRAAVSLNRFFGDGKPQARAGNRADILGAVKRLKKMLEIRRRDTDSFIAHAQQGRFKRDPDMFAL